MSDEIIIRPYEAADRQAVRQICYETGFMGSSIASQYGDFESYADIFSAYYTDQEPDLAFVATQSGQVVGYALSALDSRKVWSPMMVALRHAITRLACFRAGTFRFYLRSTYDLLRDLGSRHRPSFDRARFPSHVHINLLPSARNGYAARDLMFHSFDRLSERRSPGLHGESLAINRLMINFWSRTLGGSVIESPYPAPGLRTSDGGRVALLLGLRPLDTWQPGAWKHEVQRPARRVRPTAP